MKRLIRIGSRESALAIAQSSWVADEIRKKFPDYGFEVVGFKTQGDMLLDQRLDKIGGKGLFTRELENALLNGSIDIAVHSMKDMPARLPDGLTIAAVPKREDARDALITKDGKTLEQLGNNAIIGTSSLRREAQMRELRPDLRFKTLRGNVPTRISRLDNGEYDAVILAMAGLKRLGLASWRVRSFGVEEMIPAAGQGALGIEARKDDDTAYLIESVHDMDAFLAVSAERAFMLKLNGSCSTPVAAHAVIAGQEMRIYGFLAREDNMKYCRDCIEGNKHEAELLGELLADRIKSKLRL